jgi:hypothetical protein
MLFKILGLERSYGMGSPPPGLKKPRQVFVTKSRVLAGKVKEYYVKLSESLSTAGLSPQQLAELSKHKRSQQQDTALLDQDEEGTWSDDIPSRFSLLRDEHFPLFITFSDVSKDIYVVTVFDIPDFSCAI